ncbi:hypothetical protein [Chamaesiphon sp.]|uniref:hypothetical protein n=1 Tax=Chamaesiphon sp. TaxID=2814140 RepID=UPI003593C5E1
MSMFWYKFFVVLFALTMAILFDLYIYDPRIRRVLENDDTSSILNNELVIRFIAPIILCSAVGMIAIFGFYTYLPSPNVYQISSILSASQIYIVDDYSSIGGVSFKCDSNTIHLGNAEVKEVPRSRAVDSSAKLCNQ